jgi:hypothetical protein
MPWTRIMYQSYQAVQPDLAFETWVGTEAGLPPNLQPHEDTPPTRKLIPTNPSPPQNS